MVQINNLNVEPSGRNSTSSLKKLDSWIERKERLKKSLIRCSCIPAADANNADHLIALFEKRAWKREAKRKKLYEHIGFEGNGERRWRYNEDIWTGEAKERKRKKKKTRSMSRRQRLILCSSPGNNDMLIKSGRTRHPGEPWTQRWIFNTLLWKWSLTEKSKWNLYKILGR